jgi:S1-C subfamily serine protease
VDGKSVKDSSEVASAISQKRPGDSAEITYYRGDSKKTATVELAKRPNSADQPSSDEGGGGGGGLLP